MADGDAPVEAVDVTKARRGAGRSLDELEAAAEVSKERRVPGRLRTRNAVAPQAHLRVFPRVAQPGFRRGCPRREPTLGDGTAHGVHQLLVEGDVGPREQHGTK